VFTARYELGPYIAQIRFVFNKLTSSVLYKVVSSNYVCIFMKTDCTCINFNVNLIANVIFVYNKLWYYK
jgi:hypothetical protein